MLVPDRFNYPPANFCIYCGVEGVPLTDEHIIPYSLGGHRVFPHATCELCANRTSTINRRCCDTIFRNLRVHIEAPTYRPKNRRKTIESYIVNAEAGDNEITADGNQGAIAFPVLTPPGILFGRSPADGATLLGVYAKGTNPALSQDLMANDGQNSRSACGFDVVALLRLVAQVARGFIASQDATRAVQDIIGRALITPDFNIPYLVGGCELGVPCVVPVIRNSDAIHQVRAVPVVIAGESYIAVQMRFFASIYPDAPVYMAIAGKQQLPADGQFYERRDPYAFSPKSSLGSEFTWTLQGWPLAGFHLFAKPARPLRPLLDSQFMLSMLGAVRNE